MVSKTAGAAANLTIPAPGHIAGRMILTMLQIALGGAIGAVLRYLTGLAMLRLMGLGGFPIGTLAVNIIGSFLMGVFVVYATSRSAGAWQPFVMTGVLGGFTTFSAFSLETVTLLERGAIGQAGLYVALCVAASILALMLGAAMARGLWV